MFFSFCAIKQKYFRNHTASELEHSPSYRLWLQLSPPWWRLSLNGPRRCGFSSALAASLSTSRASSVVMAMRRAWWRTWRSPCTSCPISNCTFILRVSPRARPTWLVSWRYEYPVHRRCGTGFRMRSGWGIGWWWGGIRSTSMSASTNSKPLPTGRREMSQMVSKWFYKMNPVPKRHWLRMKSWFSLYHLHVTCRVRRCGDNWSDDLHNSPLWQEIWITPV